MAIVTLLIIFGILALVWGDIGKLGAGLVGIHEDRSGMFNLDGNDPSMGFCRAIVSLY